MKIIKIDKSTIKRNPNAGSTQTIIKGPTEAMFKIEGSHIPKWIYKEPFIITEEERELVASKSKSKSAIIKRISGVINGPITSDQLGNWKNHNLTININFNHQVIDHFPEPDYFFNYKETYLKCKHCKNKVEIDEIETDWINDEYEVKICLICKAENSFPKYKYQTLKEIGYE
jgi:hypothetical protein